MIKTANIAFVFGLSLVLGLGLGGCKREKEIRKEKQEMKAEMVRDANPMLFDPKQEIEATPETYLVRITTNQGPCWVEVNRSWAPNAADRFYRLVKSGYFTMCPIYRSLPNIFIQWGIHHDPEVGALWKDELFEADQLMKSNLEGYVGFSPDPVVGGLSTQIYINLRDNIPIDEKGYVPFGKVVRGLGRMRRIYAKYGETLQEGNTKGPDMAAAWERGYRYFKRNFGNLDLVKSITFSEESMEEIENRSHKNHDSGSENDDEGEGN